MSACSDLLQPRYHQRKTRSFVHSMSNDQDSGKCHEAYRLPSVLSRQNHRYLIEILLRPFLNQAGVVPTVEAGLCYLYGFCYRARTGLLYRREGKYGLNHII